MSDSNGKPLKPPKPAKPPAPIVENVPDELKARRQWVLWKYALRNGKWTKVPHRAANPSAEASSTDPATWEGFELALSAYRATAGADGIGFVFSSDDPYAGVDFDDCLRGGELLPWALDWIMRLGVTYAEVSPSGTGLKAFYAGRLPAPKKGNKTTGRRRAGYGDDGDGEIEAYDEARYFTLTGQTWGGFPSKVERAADGALAELAAELDARAPKKAEAVGRAAPTEGGEGLAAKSDAELLDVIRRSRQGPKFVQLYDQGSTAGYPSGSEADLGLACILAWWTHGDEGRTLRLFEASALGGREKAKERPDYVARTVAAAVERNGTDGPDRRAERNGSANGGHAGGTRPAPRRQLVEVTHERHKAVAQALAALPLDPELYVRGNVLVRVVACEGEETKLGHGVKLKRAAGAPLVGAIPAAALACRITEFAELYSMRPDRNGESMAVPVHPPDWLVPAVLAEGRYPGVRRLAGVAEAPFPRPDGTLAAKPGYDAATGFLLSLSVDVGPVPERPTQDDARAAAGRLQGLVGQFPFVGPDDVAAWMAGLLTAIARPGIRGPVPGFAFNGNMAGTGKGKLVDTIGVVANGRAVPTSAYPHDPAEAEKVKLALALSAVSCVHFDNVSEGALYGSGPLDSALTSMTVGGRILGQSQVVSGVELRPTWFLTGNNVAPGKDAYRRWIPVNLATELERPEERDDIEVSDLLGHAETNRADLLRDALTIFRAHSAAGYPNGRWGPLGSFEEWDKVVRGAVWFATGRDPNATRRAAAEDAPERRDKIALLEAWAALPGGSGSGLTVAAALDKHGEEEALKTAAATYARGGKPITARVLGAAIRGMKGQNVNGMAFKPNGNYQNSVLWIVVNLNPNYPKSRPLAHLATQLGESGESGESVSGYSAQVSDTKLDVMVCGDTPGNWGDEPETDSPDSPDSPVPSEGVRWQL